MTKKSIIVSILILSITGCVTWNKFQIIDIENIAQAQTLTLIADTKLVHGAARAFSQRKNVHATKPFFAPKKLTID